MVSITKPLCTALLAVCSPVSAVSEGLDDQQSTYDTVDSQQIIEWLDRATYLNYQSPRIAVQPNVVDYITGYQEYLEEQERLRQEEIKRQEELKRKAEEERIRKEQEELERQRIAEQKQLEWENSFNRTGYRQTVYSVSEGEVQLGSGYNKSHSRVKPINNVMHFLDDTYGWLPIYAININEVTSSGQNERGIWNAYGSVIELKQGTKTWKGIVLDACGQCAKEDKIDLWVYDTNLALDISNINWKFIRRGW